MNLLKTPKGFSLIEVLVALSVIAGSLIVVSMAWSTSHLRLKRMKVNHQVAYLLDLKVAEIERRYRNEISLLPEEDEGDFTELDTNYKDYAWKMVSKKFEMPDLGPLLSQQSGGDAQNPMFNMIIQQMTEFFNQSVRELTVTVIYTFKKNSVQYSASTFLIDYSQTLPMPSLGGGGAPGGPAAGGGDDGSADGETN
jgi:general secretion pathway protein I